MDYTGLLPPFKVNRPLSDEERHLQLLQGKKLNIDPVCQLVVIKINGTYLEMTDKFYPLKGWLTFGSGLVTLLLAGFLVAIAWTLWPQVSFEVPLLSGPLNALHALVIVGSVNLVALVAAVWLLRLESFRYTHYPIRFNRKTRMVHAFRYDGSVLSAKWDDLFFTLGRGNRANMSQNWDVRAHVLDADGQTVRETFSLGMDIEDQDLLRRFWEFHRRYMEEGPAAVASIVEVFMPISDRRETFMFGLRRWQGNYAASPVAYYFIAPLMPFIAAGRWFAMRTSKIPKWPEDVEAACRIEPGDAFARDASTNPYHLRR